MEHKLKHFLILPLAGTLLFGLAACDAAEDPPYEASEEKAVEGEVQPPDAPSRVNQEAGTADVEGQRTLLQETEGQPGAPEDGEGQPGAPEDGEAPQGDAGATAGAADYRAVQAETMSPEGYAMGGVSLGDPDAPVTVIEYASMTCGACARFATEVLPQLKEEYVRTGKVHFVFRNFVRDRLDLALATLARCQGPSKFFPVTDLYFTRWQEWTSAEEPLEGAAALARRAGISRTEFDRCLADRKLQEHLIEMAQEGQKKWDVQATPTIIINGEKAGVEALNWEGLKKMIEAEL